MNWIWRGLRESRLLLLSHTRSMFTINASINPIILRHCSRNARGMSFKMIWPFCPKDSRKTTRHTEDRYPLHVNSILANIVNALTILSIFLQADVTRKLEMDVIKLQRELEECHGQNESQLSSFRKKHQEAVNQLNDQLEQIQRSRQK